MFPWKPHSQPGPPWQGSAAPHAPFCPVCSSFLPLCTLQLLSAYRVVLVAFLRFLCRLTANKYKYSHVVRDAIVVATETLVGDVALRRVVSSDSVAVVKIGFRTRHLSTCKQKENDNSFKTNAKKNNGSCARVKTRFYVVADPGVRGAKSRQNEKKIAGSSLPWGTLTEETKRPRDLSNVSNFATCASRSRTHLVSPPRL